MRALDKPCKPPKNGQIEGCLAHGLDFADAHAVFKGVVFTFEDKRRSYGEQRLVALGMLEDVVVAIAFTEPDDDLIRIISMRKATRNEQRIYFKKLSD